MGVTRLDGARGKKRVWRPVVETEVFRKQMNCIEKVVVALLGHFGHPLLTFGAPIVIRHPGNRATLASPCYAPETGICSPWKLGLRNKISRKPEVSSLISIDSLYSCNEGLFTSMTLTLYKSQVHSSGVMQ